MPTSSEGASMTGGSRVPFVPAVVSQQPIHAAHYAARHVAYQPAQRHNATAAIIAASQSLHQKRATDALAEFDTLRAAHRARVAVRF
jgi:hypothetical protein